MAGPSPTLAGYEFTDPWEMVPGPWTYAVIFEGEVLAEKQFDVVQETPRTKSLCSPVSDRGMQKQRPATTELVAPAMVPRHRAEG